MIMSLFDADLKVLCIRKRSGVMLRELAFHKCKLCMIVSLTPC